MKTKRPAIDPEVRAMTIAQLSELIGSYSRQRQAAAHEGYLINAARKAGAPDAPVLSDHDKAVNERAKQLTLGLNGHAPSFTLPPDITREQTLKIEVDALDRVIAALSRTELVTRAAEAVTYAERHGDEWRNLARQAVLVAIRLDAIERRGREMLDEAGGAFGVLPVICHFGGGRPIAETPVEDLAAAALAENIVTGREIAEAQNVQQ